MATVTITVTPVNDVPVVAPDTYSTPEDTPLSVAAPGVLINDVDVDGDALQSSVISNPSSGTLVLNSNGSFLYTPNSDFTGIDEFTYKASDGTTESLEVTVTILVGVVNDAPVAQPDMFLVDENGVLDVPAPGVLANDTDVDSNTLTIANVIDGPLHGTLTWLPDGSFIYTPDADFNGTDTFRYQATDGMDNSAPVLVTLIVAAMNDLPVINPDAYSTNEDTPLAVSAPGVLANDYDVDGDTLSATLVNGPANGSVVLDSDGSFVYSPDADFNGIDTFNYKVSDGTSDTLATTVTITVASVNDVPVAQPDAYSMLEDTTLTVPAPGLLANDSDDSTPTMQVQVVTGVLHGTLTPAAMAASHTYPTPNWNGVDSFTYRVSDGEALSNIVTVTITVEAVNDAPVVNDDYYSVNEDSFLTVSAPGVLSNDSDADGDTLQAQVVDGPANGTVVLQSNGSFLYTPNANFGGSDSFTYKVTDGTTETAAATVYITVNPINDVPVAVDDSYTMFEDTVLVVSALQGRLANDSDDDGDTLTAVVVMPPLHGTLTNALGNGRFTYTPAPNFNGVDTFTYYGQRRSGRLQRGHGDDHGSCSERCSGCGSRYVQHARRHAFERGGSGRSDQRRATLTVTRCSRAWFPTRAAERWCCRATVRSSTPRTPTSRVSISSPTRRATARRSRSK